MTNVAEEALDVLVNGCTGVTWFLGALEGRYAATPFAVRLRYTRTLDPRHPAWVADRGGPFQRGH